MFRGNASLLTTAADYYDISQLAGARSLNQVVPLLDKAGKRLYGNCMTGCASYSGGRRHRSYIERDQVVIKRRAVTQCELTLRGIDSVRTCLLEAGLGPMRE